MTRIKDISEIMTAFTINYPDMAKAKTARFGSLPPEEDNDFRNGGVTERINVAPESGLLIIQRVETNLSYIVDHYKLYGDMIGLHCTLPQNDLRAKWEPYLAVCPKEIDIDNWQNIGPWNSEVDRYISSPDTPCNYFKAQHMGWRYKIDWVGEWDLGGDIGPRLIIVLANNVPGTIKESWAWDVEGKYGLVGMKHEHPTGEWAVEVYSQLVAFNFEYEECGHVRA